MKTILLVDDEYEIIEALKSILEDEGYVIISCQDGLEAQNYLKENKPDLIITDIMMPRLSGYDLLKFIREKKELESTPTIIMSCVNPLLKKTEYNWDFFLKKPFSLQQLVDTIEKLI